MMVINPMPFFHWLKKGASFWQVRMARQNISPGWPMGNLDVVSRKV